MSTTDAPSTRTTGADGVRWDLTDLYPTEDELHTALTATEADAAAFGEQFRGRIADLDASRLGTALESLGDLHDRAGRAYTYAYLAWSTATEDPARGALLQSVREAYTRIGQSVLFFDVEWARLDPERARALLDDPALAPYRHTL
ncbi:MAG: oligoendopeptidase F, partial [Bacteroidota bacterium]